MNNVKSVDLEIIVFNSAGIKTTEDIGEVIMPGTEPS